MIDGSEKRKRQLAFELQSSHVIENRSNINLPNSIDLDVAFYMHLIQQLDSVHVKCDV